MISKVIHRFHRWFQGPPRTWDPLMVSGTHTIPISLEILMGMMNFPALWSTCFFAHRMTGRWCQLWVREGRWNKRKIKMKGMFIKAMNFLCPGMLFSNLIPPKIFVFFINLFRYVYQNSRIRPRRSFPQRIFVRPHLPYVSLSKSWLIWGTIRYESTLCCCLQRNQQGRGLPGQRRLCRKTT